MATSFAIPKDGTPLGNRQIDDAVISIKPFTNASDNIIYCCVTAALCWYTDKSQDPQQHEVYPCTDR